MLLEDENIQGSLGRETGRAGLDMVTHILLISALRRQKLEISVSLRPALVYLASSGPARAT